MIEENQEHDEQEDLSKDPEAASTEGGDGDDGSGADMEQVIRIKGMYNEYFLDYASYVNFGASGSALARLSLIHI